MFEINQSLSDIQHINNGNYQQINNRNTARDAASHNS